MRCTKPLPSLESLALAELPDGGRVAVARDTHALWRWDAVTARPLGEPIENSSLLWADSRAQKVVTTGTLMITGVAGGGLGRWDTRSGEAVGVQAGAVWSLASSTLPDGAPVVVSGGVDGLVHRWDPRGGSEYGEPIRGCGRAVAIAVTSSVICVLSAKGYLRT
jgi:hypothetical protein